MTITRPSHSPNKTCKSLLPFPWCIPDMKAINLMRTTSPKEVCAFPWAAPPALPDCARDLWCVCTQGVLWHSKEQIGGVKCLCDHSYSQRNRDITTAHRPHSTLHISREARGSGAFPALPHRLTGRFGGWTGAKETHSGWGKGLQDGTHFSMGKKAQKECEVKCLHQYKIQIISRLFHLFLIV